MKTQFEGSKCEKVGIGLCILLAAAMGLYDVDIGLAVLIGFIGSSLICFLSYVSWVLLEENSKESFNENIPDNEFWDKAMPHLMEGRVVSGHRRSDGTIDLYVGDKPEDPEDKEV